MKTKRDSNYRRISSIVRATFMGLQRARQCPIQIIDGFTKPEISGKQGYWTTPNGSICHYPNAYRRAYGKPIYNCSTIKITVGAGWIIEQMLANDDKQDAKKAERREQRLREQQTFEEIKKILARPIHHEGFRFTSEGGFVPLESIN